MKGAVAPLAACALLGAATVVAQTKDPVPGVQMPEPPPDQRPRLNLKLDNPSSWATVAPDPGREPVENLPALGGDARPLPQSPLSRPERGETNSPIPKDTNPGY